MPGITACFPIIRKQTKQAKIQTQRNRNSFLAPPKINKTETASLSYRQKICAIYEFSAYHPPTSTYFSLPLPLPDNTTNLHNTLCNTQFPFATQHHPAPLDNSDSTIPHQKHSSILLSFYPTIPPPIHSSTHLPLRPSVTTFLPTSPLLYPPTPRLLSSSTSPLFHHPASKHPILPPPLHPAPIDPFCPSHPLRSSASLRLHCNSMAET